ncbi:MAG: tetratricopeptide repeat protein [Methanoregula sp.]|nr:tetratricopeptide repeat protein [Methanoregula sp.]
MDFLANNIKNLITKGNLLAELGHYDEALSYYFRILEIDPSNQEVLLNLGHSLIELKKYPEAITCYDTLLKINFKNSLAWQQKGYILLQMDRTEEAISCLDFSIQNNPDNSDALLLLASTLMKLKKYNEAILCYDKCLETCDPDFYVKALWSRGLAFDKLGQKNESNTQEKIESNSTIKINCEDSAPTSTGHLNYYESVGNIQRFINDEVEIPPGSFWQLAQAESDNSSVETEEEPDYSDDYSPERDEESDEEYYERLEREMEDLGDYNEIQYYRTCENSEDDYELEY